MKSSGALSLSELDSNKFAKGAAQQAAPNPIPAQGQGGFCGQPTGGFGQQPAGGFDAPADFGAQPTQAQGFSQPAGGFALSQQVVSDNQLGDLNSNQQVDMYSNLSKT